MKKKVKEELKLKTIQELNKLLEDSRDLIFKLKLDKFQNKLKNQRQIFVERKKVALILTFLNEKGKEEKFQKVLKVKKPKKEEKINA